MSEATRKAKGPDVEAISTIEDFERVYRDWHAARAAAYDPDAPDDRKPGLMDKCNEAEKALMTAVAPLPWAVFHKWELLDYMVTDEAEAGRYTDNRVIVALASIKADVLRFGLKDPQ
jgi:hypothetical protein